MRNVLLLIGMSYLRLNFVYARTYQNANNGLKEQLQELYVLIVAAAEIRIHTLLIFISNERAIVI